jgi:ribonuclease VapC
MSAITVGEVYYFLRKNRSVAASQTWRKLAGSLPVTIEIPDLANVWAAAELKSKHPISYADAFAAELGLRYKCPVVTGDPEFRSVAGLDLEWVGR